MSLTKKSFLPYKITPEIEDLVREIEEVNDFAGYYKLTPDLFAQQRSQSMHKRMLYYVASPQEVMGMDDFEKLMGGVKKPDNITAQKILNICRVLQYGELYSNEKPAMQLLKKMHTLLHEGVSSEASTGRIREQSEGLFSQVKSSAKGMPAEPLVYADTYDKLASDFRLHPVIRCWLVYFFTASLQPFDSENELMARAVCNYILETEGYGFNGLLKTEKFVFHSKKIMAFLLSQKTEEKEISEILETDMTAFLYICLSGLMHNVREIEDVYFRKLKEKTGMQNATPRQQNNFNFWIDIGFPMHRQKLENLTQKQEEIIWHICREGELDKEAICSKFNEPKTETEKDIQRLQEVGIITEKQKGLYGFDYRTHIPDEAISLTDGNL